MNFKDILSKVAQEDTQVFEEQSQRRQLLKNFATKFAAAAIPFAIGSMPKKAQAQMTSTPIDAMKYGLTFQYLEKIFYANALANPSVFPDDLTKAAFQKIYEDEAGHVEFFEYLITSTGESLPPIPGVDFSGGDGSGEGPFKNAFNDFKMLLELAQTFEDIGLRAMKGLVKTVSTHDYFLTSLMQVHTTDARHAAKIRIMRRTYYGVQSVKPWVSGNSSGITNVYFADYYAGEENTTQEGINVQGLNGQAISMMAASEAFDEPMEALDVTDAIKIFIPGV